MVTDLQSFAAGIIPMMAQQNLLEFSKQYYLTIQVTIQVLMINESEQLSTSI